MKYDNNKYTLVPVGIEVNTESIICKLIAKTDNIKKTNKKEIGDKRIRIGLREQISYDKIKRIMFQYKVARCGSTLLSNMLEKDNSWKIISEPGIFGKIANTKGINREKYLRKALEIFLIKESTHQTHCYIDFNSQIIFQKEVLSRAFPNVPNFYLYRRPVEVAQSLDAKSPGWLKNYKNSNEYLKKVCKCVEGMRVHYYRNVLSMQVVDWLYKEMNKKLTHELYNDMKLSLDYYSKKLSKKYTDEQEPTAENVDSKYKEYFYDETFTNFFISNPPYKFLEEGSNKIEKLDWLKDKKQVLRLIDKGTTPVVISNVSLSSDLIETRKVWNRKLAGLRATRENYFIWHTESNKRPDNYELFSRWDKKTFDEWKKTQDMYLVVGSNISSKEHPLFDHFLKKHKEKNGHLRISHNGAVTCEHYDGGDTILYVGGGKKKMHLLEPDVSNHLGTYAGNHKLGRRIIPNLMYLDTFKYDINKKQIWWGEMNEGELIYFPGKWAHLTITEKENTWSINFRRNSTETRKIIGHKKLKHIRQLENTLHPYFRKGDFI